MKKISQSLLTMIIFFLLTNGCQEKKHVLSDQSLTIIDKNNKLIEKQVDSIERSFVLLDKNVQKNGYWFCMYLGLKKGTDKIISLINTDDFAKSLDDYIVCFRSPYVKEISELNELKNLHKEVPKEIIINKIRLIELLIANSFYTAFEEQYFKFDLVQTIVVPDKNPIKLGETFSAKIFLAGVKSDQRFKIIGIPESQFAFGSDSLDLIYISKPKSRGKQTVEGSLLIHGRKYNFDFKSPIKIEYTVE